MRLPKWPDSCQLKTFLPIWFLCRSAKKRRGEQEFNNQTHPVYKPNKLTPCLITRPLKNSRSNELIPSYEYVWVACICSPVFFRLWTKNSVSKTTLITSIRAYPGVLSFRELFDINRSLYLFTPPTTFVCLVRTLRSSPTLHLWLARYIQNRWW